MSSKLSRVVLAAGLLMGAWSFSSCSQQDGSPRTEETDAANYSRVPVSLSVEATLQPLAESSARAMSLELSDDEAKKKFPKLKGLKEGTEVLCVIRSSNPRQPVNYLKATWTKKEGTERYTISFDETTTGTPGTGTGFSYEDSEPLGDLSMMIISGGEWDAENKQLKVTPKLVRAEGSTMDYDLPCVSEWRPLKYEFKNGQDDPSSLRLLLKTYDFDAENPEHYTLKPVGMLLRMPVEEEMAEDGGGRYILHGIAIRSTAFGSQGYFNLSKSNIESIPSEEINANKPYYRRLWVFNYGPTQYDKLDVVNPIPHTFEDGYTEYGTRKLRKYKPRYYLFLWVMPRGQQKDDVTNERVDTQIFANVDVAPADGRPIVYSNSSAADEYEVNGHNGEKYAVVPRMKALPVYASDRLVRKKDGTDAAFVEGTSYTLTLNLNRPDLPLDLLSYSPVNKNLNGFAKKINEVYYVPTRGAGAEVSKVEQGFRTNTGLTSWSVPSYERMALLVGTLFGKGTLDPSVTLLDNDPRPGQAPKYINPDAFPDAGTYGINKFANGSINKTRLRLGFHTLKSVDDPSKYVSYTMLFYPPMKRGTAHNRRGDRLCVMRTEYVDNSPYGGPAYKMTMRYIGTYSTDLGIISPDLPEVNDESEQRAAIVAALEHVIAKGDDYWNDNFRSQDDIVRYLPLWQRNPATQKTYKHGDADYTWGDMGCMPFNTGSVTYVCYGKLGIGYDAIGGSSGYEKLNREAPILLMRDRLTHK